MIAVIPARGGSKRVPQKNIATIGKKPLISYTIQAFQAAKLDIPLFVTTDDLAIAEVAKSEGANVIMRPDHLASDKASTESALIHVLESVNFKPGWVFTLQPTSPFRKPSTIIDVVNEASSAASDVDCIMTLHENRDDYWHINDQGELARLFPNAPRRQQDRTPLYVENSSIYATRYSALIETGSILGKNKIIPKIISIDEALDINTQDDIDYANYMILNNKSVN